MDDVFGRLRRQPVLAARSDQPHQRAASLAAVGVSDRRARPSRDDAAGDRRRHVPDDAAEPRVCGGHAHRPAALALPADAAERDVALLRSAEPRLRARSATACSWARSTRTSSSLDAKTGRVRWDVAAADADKGYSFTGAPLVVKNKIIVGVAGGEYGVRGFIDAYDAETGSARGACTRFPAKARRATTPGRATRGSAAARRPGSPARTIRSST